MKRPFTIWVLVFWLVFLAFGGFYGGITMLLDPSGKKIGMDEVLPLLPVNDYTIVGVFLVVVMGLIPLFLDFGTIARPDWKWARIFSFGSSKHWAWVGALVLGIGLGVWLIIQGLMIGFRWPIQYVTAANALFILIFTLSPPVQKYLTR